VSNPFTSFYLAIKEECAKHVLHTLSAFATKVLVGTEYVMQTQTQMENTGMQLLQSNKRQDLFVCSNSNPST